jgi:hypothetical protein
VTNYIVKKKKSLSLKGQFQSTQISGKELLEHVECWAFGQARVSFSALLAGGRNAWHVLDFCQAADGESNDLNHPQSEFVLERSNEMKIGIGKANGRGLELVTFHGCVKFYNIKALVSLTQSNAGEQSDSETASFRYRYAKKFRKSLRNILIRDVEVVNTIYIRSGAGKSVSGGPADSRKRTMSKEYPLLCL